MDEIIIGGIGTGVIITFLVSLAKRFGLPDGYAGVAAAVLSVAAYGLYQVVQLFPVAEPTIVGVLKVLAFIAVTFGGSTLTYLGSRSARLPVLGYSQRK